jgi:hypothetical protein
MPAPLDVNQVRTIEQIAVVQNLVRRSLRHEASTLEHEAKVRDVFERSQVIRSRYHRPHSAAPFHQQVDDPALASRIERRSRLVK